MTLVSLLLFCSLLLLIFSLSLSNKQAQQCFQKAVNSQKCSSSLTACYSNKLCQSQINSFPCDFMNNDYLFNGYCFNHWYEKAVLSKDLITCLVGECDLRANSKYNMTKFFECNSEVVEGMKDMVCGEECYRELEKVMGCMQEKPVEVCYGEERGNAEAETIIKKIRKECLGEEKETKDDGEVEDEL